MVNIWFAALPVCILAGSVPTRAIAGVDDRDCRAYDKARDASLDPDLLPLDDGMTLRVCEPPKQWEEKRHEIVSQPWKGNFDVCHYEAQTLTPITTPAGEVVLSQGMSTYDQAIIQHSYLAMSKGRCPPRSDPRYIEVSGVSEGVFAALVTLLDGLQRSKESYERTCFQPLLQLRQGLEEARFVRPEFDEFTAFLKAGPSQIRAIALDNFENELFGPVQYQIWIDDADMWIWSKTLNIMAELTPSGFCVTRISVSQY